jgi:hypothetical protein
MSAVVSVYSLRDNAIALHGDQACIEEKENPQPSSTEHADGATHTRQFQKHDPYAIQSDTRDVRVQQGQVCIPRLDQDVAQVRTVRSDKQDAFVHIQTSWSGGRNMAGSIGSMGK